MKNEFSYLYTLCEIVTRLRCWVRISPIDGLSINEMQWGQLLTIPTTGYLETRDGPLAMRDVEWVDVSTKLVKGGIGGKPLQLIDATSEILTGLQGTELIWELIDSLWSVNGVFEMESVQVVRVKNPFYLQHENS